MRVQRLTGREVRKENERMTMMENAIRLIETFIHRSRPLDLGDAPKVEKELDKDETACYKSALRYLTKEFNLGHRDEAGVSDDDLPEDPERKPRVPSKR